MPKFQLKEKCMELKMIGLRLGNSTIMYPNGDHSKSQLLFNRKRRRIRNFLLKYPQLDTGELHRKYPI